MLSTFMHLIPSSQQLYQVATITISFLYIGKMRLKEREVIAQDKQDLSLTLELKLLSLMLLCQIRISMYILMNELDYEIKASYHDQLFSHAPLMNSLHSQPSSMTNGLVLHSYLSGSMDQGRRVLLSH